MYNLCRTDAADLRLRIDLTPFMNRAPPTVRADITATRAHIMLRAMGLRHLCVVDGQNRAIGIITRKDLIAGLLDLVAARRGLRM